MTRDEFIQRAAIEMVNKSTSPEMAVREAIRLYKALLVKDINFDSDCGETPLL